MHSLGLCHTTVDSRRANGQQAERWGKIEQVQKRLREMFQFEKGKKTSPLMLFTVHLSVAGFADGVGFLTIW